MNARTLAILSLCVASASALGNEFVPDWMPPPPPRENVWDVFQEAPTAAPSAVLSNPLLIFAASTMPVKGIDPDRLKTANISDTDLGKVSSNLDLSDPRDPKAIPVRDWKANQSLNVPLPVSQSAFMFGNVDSSGNSLDNQSVNMKGRTGLGWKWAPFGGSELQFKTGTLMSYASASTTSTATSTTQLSVALQAKLDLLGPLQLQYSGEALPAVLQTDHHTLLTDLKLAVPLGANQEVYLGAKYKWEDTTTPSPWTDRTQLYLGLKFQR